MQAGLWFPFGSAEVRERAVTRLEDAVANPAVEFGGELRAWAGLVKLKYGRVELRTEHVTAGQCWHRFSWAALKGGGNEEPAPLGSDPGTRAATEWTIRAATGERARVAARSVEDHGHHRSLA